jgi:hypothetical protein
MEGALRPHPEAPAAVAALHADVAEADVCPGKHALTASGHIRVGLRATRQCQDQQPRGVHACSPLVPHWTHLRLLRHHGGRTASTVLTRPDERRRKSKCVVPAQVLFSFLKKWGLCLLLQVKSPLPIKLLQSQSYGVRKALNAVGSSVPQAPGASETDFFAKNSGSV